MSLPPAAASHPALPTLEVLELCETPIVLFDANAVLSVANQAFATLFAAIQKFTDPGTDWAMFLNEAERHNVLSAATCQDLRLIEERLLTGSDVQPAVEARVSGGLLYEVNLAQTSDGGFALRFHPTLDQDEIAEGDREIEVLMAKVLEACPANLTMARIGDGRILYRSPAATDLLGKGNNSQSHFARREDRADFLTTLLPDARVDDMRIIARRPNGDDFPASISARLIDYRGEEVVVSNMVDLTDTLEIQTQLAHQKEQVFRAEKMSALGELLAGVAHELNNPLSIVVGNAQLLAEEDLDDDILRRVEKLSAAAERCVRIVRSFLAMARERPLNIEARPIAEIVDVAIDAFQANEGGDTLDISVDLGQSLKDVLIDEVQIVQVISNLLINASHATTDAGIAGHVRIVAEPAPAGSDMVRLSITDNGPGVPVEIASRVFDPLFTTKSAGKGTGVGLALCHRIMAAHSGAIELDTLRGPGARFILDFPTRKT